MKTLNIFLSGLVILPFLAGCGDSNALKDYSNVKGSTPSDQKPVSQEVVGENKFNLLVVGPKDVTFPNFTQAQTSEILLKVQVNSPEILDVDLQLVDFPMTDAPILTKTNQPRVYSLKWTPPLGTVKKGRTSEDLIAKFRASVSAITPNANPQLRNVINDMTLQIQVKGNEAVPVIVGTPKLDVIEEGRESQFVVEVDDPGSAVDQIGTPDVLKADFLAGNTEAYRANGAPYVSLISKERIGKTRWKFTHSVYADHLPLDHDRRGHEIPSASTVPVCFFIMAQSVYGTLSDRMEICAEGRYAAQPPMMTISDGTDVKAGVENTITVKALVTHPLGVVTFTEPPRQIANLPGKKDINCVYDSDKKNAATCTIKWTPNCVKAAYTAKFQIKADNTLNEVVKSSTLQKELTVQPNAEACSAQGGRQ